MPRKTEKPSLSLALRRFTSGFLWPNILLRPVYRRELWKAIWRKDGIQPRN